MGYFSREEWLAGCAVFSSATSMAELRDCLKKVHEATVRDAAALRILHSFTHKFRRENERARNIEVRARAAPSARTRGGALRCAPERSS
eukprot:6436279-Prymnesium_polylepis.1